MNKNKILRLLTLALAISFIHLTSIAYGGSCCASGKGAAITEEEKGNTEPPTSETNSGKEESDTHSEGDASSEQTSTD